MITTILFDLDGTLLPMDMDECMRAYMGTLAAKMAVHGYEPEALVKNVWKGTGAMAANDGKRSNEEVFWDFFSGIYGQDVRKDEPLFEEYYRVEFQQVKDACGFTPWSGEIIKKLKEMGYRLVLATNPLFPAIATQSRIRWAGMDPKDFSLVTTYENSRHCKPNPDYYRDILDTLELTPEECLMVGNDVVEDMAAEQLGMKVFLLTDCLINKFGADISRFPNGSFPELMAFICSL